MPTTSTKTTTRSLSGFLYTKFVVIQSLAANEAPTGKILWDYLSTLDSFVAKDIPLEIHNCATKSQLIACLKSYIHEAKSNHSYPILHFECHGLANGNGLVLSNDEHIEWTELAPLLIELNLSTKFNLLVFFAACDAFYFIEEMKAIRPSPVYAVVAPSDSVDPAEVMRGGRIYYQVLFDTNDAGHALKALKSERLSTGNWFGQTAEEWFEKILIDYTRTHCSAEEISARAQRLFREQPSHGLRKSIGALKRALHQKHRTFVDDYFHKCFFTEDIPENVERFSVLRNRVKREVRNIFNQPAYKL